MERDVSKSEAPRREALETAGRWGLVLGLTAAYGTFASYLVRFLFPSGPADRGWMYVAPLARLGVGDALLFKTPKGATVNIARQAEDNAPEAFIALSSTCPHLGCQVHWEAQNDRFFCPCHNGIFSPDGIGIGGPPGDAGQNLPRYPLRVDGGLLYIEVAVDELAMGSGEILDGVDGPPGPGHDPCLFACAVNPQTRRA
ncbi:MAG: Rieske 2Fe-2S domain-containing protein [Acidobacteriota bacterium]